ncbi:OmpA family protein [Anaeromyxobacter oryzisoli]|uniref:OmpA family protein n=1 Tax=Anaeromyxobacter oryzisoli TaxID=2925408 RepID=UPI001F5AB8D3|nr:OmpA family protein [Anaeromyxobacter sp. SG63]
MNRARALRLALGVGLTLACATGGKLRETAHVIRADVEKAKRSGAMRCAPKDLALAESHVDVAEEEISTGHGSQAKEHLAIAEGSARRALELSKTCGPAQVTIAKPVVKKAIVIEKTDRDGDGVPDLDDRCPDVPGKPEFQGCPDTDGDGTPDADDACPKDPGPKETQGCPVVKDSDGDGIPDDIDRCPRDPEDKDGFQDEDGCPDADNDGDGIVDRLDACPNEPGPLENRGCPILDSDGDGVPDAQDRCPTVAGSKENGGCPDADRDGDGIPDRLDKCPDQAGPAPDGCPKKYSLVVVKKEKIEIKQQIHFAYAKARVLPDSFPLLNQVAQVMKDLPDMRVSIEGHTDAIGPEASNMRLSQRRADAVRDYLVSRGISADRLETVGFGPTQPIASNKTEKGRAKNRRTEFRIVGAE